MDPVLVKMIADLVPAAVQAVLAAIAAGKSKETILLHLEHLAQESAEIGKEVDAIAAGG